MRSAAVLSLCLLVAISATAGATAPAAPVGGATDPRIATLTNWLLRLGTNMSHVRLAHTQFGLGVQTTAPIPAGSVVFELPGTAVLNLRYAQRSPLGALINASSGWLDGCEAVVVSMIYERFVRTDSPIAPFLALLPPLSELPPMPAGLLPRSALFGSTAVVVYDTVLPLWRSITANVLRFMDTHAILFPGIQTPQGRRVWEQRATWGLAVLASRTFGQRRGTDPAKCTLAPLAGMMNHHPLAYPLAARPGADKWMAQYAQVAHRDYAAGEEVLTAYDVHTRRKCNANLLVSYGFWLQVRAVAAAPAAPGACRLTRAAPAAAPQHPEHECVTVNARFNNTDNLLWPLRVDLVRLVMQNGTLRLQLHSQRPIPQYVLRLARVMAAETQAELR